MSEILDFRKYNKTYRQLDYLMGAFAMFSLKDPSLLIFRQEFEARAVNLKRIYDLTDIPSDATMRETLDKIEPNNSHSN